MTRDRHLDHFVEVAQELATQWASRRQAQADAGFEREWDNIRAAFNWALALGDFARADILVTATGAHANARILHEHGDWVNRALEQWLAGGTTAPSASLFGWAAYWETRFVAGDRQKAVALAEEGILVARTRSDPTTAICWERLCHATVAAGRVRENPVPFRGAEAAMAEVTQPVRAVEASRGAPRGGLRRRPFPGGRTAGRTHGPRRSCGRTVVAGRSGVRTAADI